MLNSLTSHAQPKNLEQWLSYLEKIHRSEIELGLTRVGEVARLLAIDLSFARVVTVAGTNGKGTTCAFLENALIDEGHSVAVYSSPHIECFNERLRVNRADIDDSSLLKAFAHIEAARGTISLTYYEYTTLAALLVMMAHRPQFIILEVGLGGRLDATNIISADIAVITSIDLDHQAFLGDTREAIGFEKAGIMRPDHYAVIGDDHIPASVLAYGQQINAKMQCREQQFQLNVAADHWQWQTRQVGDKPALTLTLPLAFIPLDNVASALMTLRLLNVELTAAKASRWIQQTKVPGRTEFFNQTNQDNQSYQVMLDVGHNPHAARYLAKKLSNNPYHKIIAVVGMLADKDIGGTLQPMSSLVDNWYVASLSEPRGATAQQVAAQVAYFTQACNCFDNVTQAFRMASQSARNNDLILVFGSFHTVAQVRRLLI